MKKEIDSIATVIKKERFLLSLTIMIVFFLSFLLIDIFFITTTFTTLENDSFAEIDNKVYERMQNSESIDEINTADSETFFLVEYNKTLNDQGWNSLTYQSGQSISKAEYITKMIDDVSSLKDGKYQLRIDNYYLCIYNKSSINELLFLKSVNVKANQVDSLFDLYYFAGIDKTASRTENFNYVFLLSLSLLSVFLLLIPLILFISNRLIRPTLKSLRKQKEFVSNASHELKTPIAIIMAQTSVLQARMGDDNADLTDGILKQCHNMNETVLDMISLSKLELTDTPKENVDISKILEDVCVSFDALAYENEIYKYEYEIEKGIIVNKASSKEFDKIFHIVLDNAMKYTTGEEKKVHIILNKYKGHAIFSITNSGCNIKDEEREKVFEKFYQGDNTLSDKRDGSGLGLALLKEICDQRHYQLSLETKYKVYTKFIIQIKL